MKNSNASPRTIDDYIATYPEPVQLTLTKIRMTIKKLAPTAIEKIAYGIPTFWLNENLVHFAAYETHIGFYPTPGGIKAFKEELSPYKTSKGAIQFPLDKPMPLSLIKKIVNYRIAEAKSHSNEKDKEN